MFFNMLKSFQNIFVLLGCTWTVVDYQLGICRATNGVYIKINLGTKIKSNRQMTYLEGFFYKINTTFGYWLGIQLNKFVSVGDNNY